MTNLYSIIKRPIITEKSSVHLKQNKISLEVDIKASKYHIGLALEKIFNIKSKSINTMIIRGKVKHVGRIIGKRKNIKKATITIDKTTDISKLILSDKLQK